MIFLFKKMGNKVQSLKLSEIEKENKIQSNYHLDIKKVLNRLNSSPINYSSLNLKEKYFDILKIFSKTNFSDLAKKQIARNYTIKCQSKDDYGLNGLMIKTNYKKYKLSKQEPEIMKCKTITSKRNRNNPLVYKGLLDKNKEKEKILKSYIHKNNELLMSEDEFNKAYKLLKSILIKNKRPVEKPIAITLGGQPGAGKSNLYDIARKRFSNNIVELDCDAFRIFHPYYHQIKKIFGKDDAIKTNPFVFRAVDSLIDELSDEKYNLIIESSLNSPNSALDNGRNLTPKGYKVELQIMATPKQVSWQGTIDRYNKELKNGGNPRAVSKEFHDNVVRNICKSLAIVKKSGLMSNILIYDRNKNCLYDMQKDKDINPCLLLFLLINGFFSKNNGLFMFVKYLINNIFNKKVL